MPDYRRAFQPGGTFFLTVVTDRRARILTTEPARKILRPAIEHTRQTLPFDMRAMVLLPDHMHLLWTLPPGDTDFSKRIGTIKKAFTEAWLARGGREQSVSASRTRDRRRGVWQRRFWEHTIRDERDYIQHCHYIHYNPVKHGVATCPHAWPHSSFHRFVTEGIYDASWQCACGATRPTPPKFEEIASTAIE